MKAAPKESIGGWQLAGPKTTMLGVRDGHRLLSTRPSINAPPSACLLSWATMALGARTHGNGGRGPPWTTKERTHSQNYDGATHVLAHQHESLRCAGDRRCHRTMAVLGALSTHSRRCPRSRSPNPAFLGVCTGITAVSSTSGQYCHTRQKAST
mmetsp:Transcript_1073/g.2021  ORF Transcript_1073/g.2021 Transcript_1073/m.2021 type:complete len:154 (+) Transcript_1073:455-916(+)